MAFDAFLQIEGLQGDSTDANHKHSIEITGYNLAATQSISRTASSAGGATTGRIYLSDFSITKLVDAATPKLLAACCSGQHFKKATLSVYRAGGDKQKYMEVTFENFIVSGFYSGNIFDALPSAFPEDVVWFSYSKIKMTYSQQSRANGQMIGQVVAGWDQERNTTYA
ncbi:Hcp family type VI secretion system effector [Pseudomonas syringae]|uniref:Hcp family type VI secretion system effector n=1 Tax=Pseudomonas syringae TaxID=317 RepID=UPI0001E2989A|nr:type VI secretion system tube protein Hcp [Pseudomonas syringae]POP68333.1 type VI secretion system tube protein Hcp [Pseudomonas syringae]